ncbi:MAG: glycerol-3-phosphate acyltransferase [Clostridiales bacterium]|nr:glycerol-3-phosphate acyltransferase [Clostridiales bacterium]
MDLPFTIVLFVLTGVAAYLVCALNPAIIMARLVYKEDIRTKGSGNPGFTNFKRVYGNKVAWFVFALDIGKTVVVILGGILLLTAFGFDRNLVASFIGICALMGHVFPVWYRFVGGKGFLVWAVAIFFCDWKAGLVALAMMALFLFTKRYMSLAVLMFCSSGTIAIIVFAAIANIPYFWPVILIMTAGTVLVTVRHRENIVRIKNGTESKFYFKSRKDDKEAPSADKKD